MLGGAEQTFSQCRAVGQVLVNVRGGWSAEVAWGREGVEVFCSDDCDR